MRHLHGVQGTMHAQDCRYVLTVAQESGFLRHQDPLFEM